MKNDVSEARFASETSCFIKKLDDTQSPKKKKKIMSVSHVPSSEPYRFESKSYCSDSCRLVSLFCSGILPSKNIACRLLPFYKEREESIAEYSKDRKGFGSRT
jgi:hypothetical protein